MFIFVSSRCSSHIVLLTPKVGEWFLLIWVLRQGIEVGFTLPALDRYHFYRSC